MKFKNFQAHTIRDVAPDGRTIHMESGEMRDLDPSMEMQAIKAGLVPLEDPQMQQMLDEARAAAAEEERAKIELEQEVANKERAELLEDKAEKARVQAEEDAAKKRSEAAKKAAETRKANEAKKG